MDLNFSFFKSNSSKSKSVDTTSVDKFVDIPLVASNDTTKSIFAGSISQSSQDTSIVTDKKYGHFKYEEVSKADLVSVKGAKKEFLHKDAAPKFNEMVADAKKEHVNLVLLSGMRSVKYQEEVFQRKHQNPEERAKLSAPPGYSEHHTGYAVDLNRLDKNFEKTKEFKWLEKNAGKYGFEMSFPKDNKQGVNYEPWHWRYIGDEKSQQTFIVARTQNIPSARISLMY